MYTQLNIFSNIIYLKTSDKNSARRQFNQYVIYYIKYYYNFSIITMLMINVLLRCHGKSMKKAYVLRIPDEKLVLWSCFQQSPSANHFLHSGSLGSQCPSAPQVMMSGPINLHPGLHLNVTLLPEWYRGLVPETINPDITSGAGQVTTSHRGAGALHVPSSVQMMSEAPINVPKRHLYDAM